MEATFGVLLGVVLLAAVIGLWQATREVRKQGVHLKLRGTGWKRHSLKDLLESWTCPYCGQVCHGAWNVIKHQEGKDSVCAWFVKHRQVFETIREGYSATEGIKVTATVVGQTGELEGSDE